jgi:hypothetical protein
MQPSVYDAILPNIDRDEGEVGKSGISSDNFRFRSLHQVLDVAHHFGQMGITGKKVTSSWSNARPLHSEPRAKARIRYARELGLA